MGASMARCNSELVTGYATSNRDGLQASTLARVAPGNRCAQTNGSCNATDRHALAQQLTQADPVTTREQIALIYANLLELAHRRGRVEHRVKRNTVHLSCTKLKTRAS